MNFNQSLYASEHDYLAVSGESRDHVVEQEGSKCELRTYELHLNSRGEQIALQVGTKKKIKSSRVSEIDSALVLTKYYKVVDGHKVLDYTKLDVKSPHLKEALRKTISRYPGLNLDSEEISFRGLPKCFFHYRKELNAYGTTIQDPTAVQHLVFALQYMYNTLHDEMSSYYSFMESPSVTPGLEHSNLWMAFRPGDLLYTRADGVDQVLRFKEMESRERYLYVYADMLTFDGRNFGLKTKTFEIAQYTGYSELRKLPIFPLEYHSDSDSVATITRARGRIFASLTGVHHRNYDGIAEVLASKQAQIQCPDCGYEEEMWSSGPDFPMVTGRVIIDRQTFDAFRPSEKKELTASSILKPRVGERFPPLSEDDYLICDHQVAGFSLARKRWCRFEVDYLTEIEYDVGAFEALLLPKEQKDMIRCLVKIHAGEQTGFDDVITGKGKGMIFLLHGVPGVGKTLTAESVADFTSRPLYVISSGELGTTAAAVEQQLSYIFRLAAIWDAIVLIDEADVFLEQRSPHDLQRNALVAVFLRTLEYYTGILFLTTNRIGNFDPAFKSRIHLAIKYQPLSYVSRRDLWNSFISKASPFVYPDWMNDECLHRLALEELNGRQIKNIVRTAYSMALSAEKELGLAHIEMALRNVRAFETDFAEDYEGLVVEPGSEPRFKKRKFNMIEIND